MHFEVQVLEHGKRSPPPYPTPMNGLVASSSHGEDERETITNHTNEVKDEISPEKLETTSAPY